MRIVFLHQNFPAQFVHIARDLMAAGHELVAIVPETHRLPTPVPLRRYMFRLPAVPSPLLDHHAHCVARGASVAVALRQLDLEGFQPDVVIGHGGWGEALFAKEVFPRARLLLHAEFCYAAEGADVGFDPEFPVSNPLLSRMRVRTRNTPMLEAMLAADLAIAPTHWQASSFPDVLHAKMAVLHEGIDTARAHPDRNATIALARQNIVLHPGDEVVTFIARNLEPYRGYHQFMRALPRILAERPRARAVIVGGDGVSYGHSPPHGGSWKEHFLKEVAGDLDMARVHFLGRVTHNALLRIMQISAAHVYLTYPFVLSWSLLEAMSAGALVVGSNTPPVEEVIAHGRNGLLCDFFDNAGLARLVIDALSDQERYAALRQAARRTIVERFDLYTVCLPQWHRLISSTLPARGSAMPLAACAGAA
jgi:glycosyltransferase involved in cell wall biosynthesis